VYDAAHGDVVYTDAWVRLLRDTLASTEKQVEIFGKLLRVRGETASLTAGEAAPAIEALAKRPSGQRRVTSEEARG